MFISEDVAETKDLMAIADYLQQWMTDPNAKAQYEKLPARLKTIEQAFNRPLPEIQSKVVQFLFFGIMPEHGHPLYITFNDEQYVDEGDAGVFMPDLWMVNIMADKIQKIKKSVGSVILHELQHALDDLKSNGALLNARAYYGPTDDHAAYMAHPAEINARFSQALWMLASNFEKIPRNQVYPAIDKVFARYKLNAESIPNPKEHKRLVVRAYKFLDEVLTVVDSEPQITKPTFVQKVKDLIRKWLPK